MFNGMLGVLIGFFLLLYGQRFFWLAAGFIAFLFGWQISSGLLGGGWLTFFLALGLGVGLTWLTVRFLRVVAYLLAFLAGAFVLVYLFNLIGIELNRYLLVLFGGLMGVVAIGLAFDWALILFTAWAGTVTIMTGVHEWITLEGALANVIFGLLLILGVLWQGSGKLKIKSLRRAWG